MGSRTLGCMTTEPLSPAPLDDQLAMQLLYQRIIVLGAKIDDPIANRIALGFAASMGQFLLGAGTPGKRFALPNARIMMHQPSAGIQGTAADVEVQAGNLKVVKQRVNELQAEHTGQSVDQITADSGRDRWFSAAQAQEYGIVDHVVTSLADVRPAGVERKVGLR